MANLKFHWLLVILLIDSALTAAAAATTTSVLLGDEDTAMNSEALQSASSHSNITTGSPGELSTTSSRPAAATDLASTSTSTAAAAGDDDGGGERFCNKTVTYTVTTECKACALTELHGCPDGFRQLTQGRGVADCSFSQRLDESAVIYQSGCRHSCERSLDIVRCCPGFWGVDCLECPGGSTIQCSGHGLCADGTFGNGTCDCLPGFTGVACEQCQKNVFGALCTNVCPCVHGVCDDGINGTGSCDCDSMFTGLFCSESLMSCERMICDNNSRCVNVAGNVECICNHGYSKDSDGLCQPINRCLSADSPCHPNALCIPTGADLYQCSCMAGYEGDGILCSVVDPCQTDFGSCPQDSTNCLFIGPGKYRCVCQDGFENYTETLGCQLINVCALNSTLCHDRATCTVVGPWEVECMCEAGFIGDGQNCYGNLLQRVEDLNNNDVTLKGQFRYALQLMSTIYSDVFTKHGPFTWFVATDSGFESSLNKNELRDIFSNIEIARQLSRQHLVAASLTLSELTNTTLFYMLEGSSADIAYKNAELRFRLHGFNVQAQVLRGDIIAANGIIHVIDKLIDKPPVVVGSAKKSISSILSVQPQYETFFSLLKAAGLNEKLSNVGHFTIFVPDNDAWSSLPAGTIQYFMSTEGKGKLLSVLENHIIEGPYVLSTDLINMQRFTSLAEVSNDIAVSPLGRITLNEFVNVTQVDIPASNGYIHHISGILAPDSLLPLLPHRCDITAERTVRGTCGMCNDELKCPWPTDIPLNETSTGCRYWVNLGIAGIQNYVAFDGCHRMCNRTYKISRCCDGFYGTACNPCPGGFQSPCLGRGKCADGYYGTGECKCDDEFYGAECEFCNNRQMFGANCTKQCTCLHGVCDNRVNGSAGRCKPYTCQAGFMGVNCDVNIQRCDKRLRLRCHAFADCIRKDNREILSNVFNRFRNVTDVDEVPDRMRLRNLRRFLASRSTCRCRQGYRGSGTFCEEVDRCKEPDRGGCHQQADCIKTGPGLNTCNCTSGWVGDGTYCYPSTPCLNHSHCHENALCVPSTPNQYMCLCEDGYHGNGTYCVLHNICTENNGGCHIKADCVAAGPGVANCSCADGFAGDGYNCYSTIGNELSTIPQLAAFSQLLQVILPEDRLLDDPTSNFTLFAPNNEAVELLLNFTSVDFWRDASNLQSLLSYHVVPSVMSLKDLRSQCQGQKITALTDDDSYALTCLLVGQEVYVNGARVVTADLPALNGFIHVIDKVLEPSSSLTAAVQPLFLTLNSQPQFTTFTSQLQSVGLIDIISTLREYTLFVPVTQTQINGAVSRRYLSYYIVPHTLTLWRLKAMNGMKIGTLLGNTVQQQIVITVTDDQVYINNIAVTEPNDLLTIGGVIHSLDGALTATLNKCDRITFDQQLEIGCCSGHYGIGCTAECPGGADNPCSSHGVCDDGLNGTGICHCRLDYTGNSCETCLLENCLQDACLLNNGGCDVTAVCKSGLQVTCSCLEGYVMRESRCIYTAGNCSVANGGCSQHAKCSTTTADTDLTTDVTCTCDNGFNGDGYICNGNVWMALSETTQAALFYQMLFGFSNDIQLVNLLSDPLSQVTVFVPIDYTCVQSLPASGLKRYIVSSVVQELTLDKLHNGTILQSLNQQSLVINTRQLTPDDEVFYTVNNVVVTRSNLPATNGVIHLIETCFTEDSTASVALRTQQQTVSNHTSVVITLTVLLVVCVTVTAMFTRRYWLQRLQSVDLHETCAILRYVRNYRRQQHLRQHCTSDIIHFNPTHNANIVDDDLNPFVELQPSSARQLQGAGDKQQLI